MFNLPLLIGYILGIGFFINTKIFRCKYENPVTYNIATSLCFWSIIAWVTGKHYSLWVYLFSIIGLLGMLIDFSTSISHIMNEWKTIKFAIIATVIRILIVLPMVYPYGRDSIMHTYTTNSLLQNNGFTQVFNPFNVPGLGSFNIGFHFISAGISILTNLDAMHSIIITGFIFLFLFFLTLNLWIKNPLYTLLIFFTLARPSNFIVWGGLPTLASITFLMGAFYYDILLNIPFWLGAFSTHFIPASAAFLSYLTKELKLKRTKKLILLFLPFILLLPQYYYILKFDKTLTIGESMAVDRYVLHTFPKALLYMFFFGITAYIGFKNKTKLSKNISPTMVIIPVILGVLSFINSYFHSTLNPIKSFYLNRMLIPIIIPSSIGLFVLFRRYKSLRIILPLSGLFIVVRGHYRITKNREEWAFIKKHVKSINPKYWTFVRYQYPETYIPAMGVPAWNSHYIITLASEFRESAEKSIFKYAFIRKNDSMKDFFVTKGIIKDSINNLYFIELTTPISGKSFIKNTKVYNK